LVRLYFNKRGGRPWSTDRGPGTPEETWKEVEFDESYCRTVYDPDAGDNVNTPTAWIEITGGRVTFIL